MDRDNTIKVAFLSQIGADKDNIGGAETHVHNLCNHLSRLKNINIHVVTVSKGKKNCVEKKGNIIYHYIHSPKLPKTLTSIVLDYWRIVNKVNEIRPDIVHAQVLGAPYGIAAQKLSKKYPTVITVHTLDELDSRTRKKISKYYLHDIIWKYLERIQLKKIHNFIIVSSILRNELDIRGAIRIWHISNGVSNEWFNIPTNENMGHILFVGRIAPIKDIEFLIKSFAIVKKEKPDVNLHIVGPIQYLDYYKKITKLIAEQNIKDINILGPKMDNELLKEFTECSVFVLPSKSESNPICLYEAMASAKPIVATNVGGIPEMLDNEREGYLVEQGNVEQLADKILTLLNDGALRERMGKAGRERVKKLTWDNIAKRTVEVYREVMEVGSRAK